MIQVKRKEISMTQTICIFASAIYLLSSLSAYGNNEITASNFILRAGVYLLMIYLL